MPGEKLENQVAGEIKAVGIDFDETFQKMGQPEHASRVALIIFIIHQKKPDIIFFIASQRLQYVLPNFQKYDADSEVIMPKLLVDELIQQLLIVKANTADDLRGQVKSNIKEYNEKAGNDQTVTAIRYVLKYAGDYLDMIDRYQKTLDPYLNLLQPEAKKAFQRLGVFNELSSYKEKIKQLKKAVELYDTTKDLDNLIEECSTFYVDLANHLTENPDLKSDAICGHAHEMDTPIMRGRPKTQMIKACVEQLKITVKASVEANEVLLIDDLEISRAEGSHFLLLDPKKNTLENIIAFYKKLGIKTEEVLCFADKIINDIKMLMKTHEGKRLLRIIEEFRGELSNSEKPLLTAAFRRGLERTVVPDSESLCKLSSCSLQ